MARYGPQFGPDITFLGVARCEITASLANRAVLEALSALACKRVDAAAGTSWDPGRPLLDGR
jgi:hypothetical protein